MDIQGIKLGYRRVGVTNVEYSTPVSINQFYRFK